LPRTSEIRYPAYLAEGDHDFIDLMKEVREQLLARKREAARRPPPEDAMTGNPLSQSMDF
jgi:hypothetical protein